jgi:hypothetical protein
MNPKEKAKELVCKMYGCEINTDLNNIYIINGDGYFIAIDSALIAVDEAIRVCPFIDEKIRETEEQLNAFQFQFVSYWQQVKTEIEKLIK